MKHKNYYKFIETPGRGQIHIWNTAKETTLCSFWSNAPDQVKKAYSFNKHLPRDAVCPGCQRVLERLCNNTKKPKGPRLAPERPEENEYLKRWKGARHTHPTFWEKMDKDPVYDRAVKIRTDEFGEHKMGTRVTGGRPKTPN